MERFSENKSSDIIYKPFCPRSNQIFSSRAKPVGELIKIESLYYLSPEIIKDDIKTISDYQQWAELGWKEPHGTAAASIRFLNKLNEEIGELVEANNNVINQHKNNDDWNYNFLEELGDIMWCVTALSSNSSADINSALKASVLDHVVDQINCSNSSLEPWQNQATNISFSNSDIKIFDIDQMIKRGFEPQIIPYESENNVEDHIEWLSLYAHEIGHHIDLQYNNPGASYDDHIDRIAKLASDIYLNIAYIAKNGVGGSLNEVVEINFNKLNKRRLTNRIDKSDGIRD